MLNVALAERILLLAIPPGRAHSSVGDLAEEAESRGSAWFWSHVVRTAGSQLGRELVAAPFTMLGLAAWGLLAQFLMAGLVFAIGLIWANFGLSWFFGAVPLAGINRLTHLIFAPAYFIPVFAAKLTADRSKGRELPAVIAMTLLSLTLSLLDAYLVANYAFFRPTYRGMPPAPPPAWPAVQAALISCLIYIPVVSATAAWARYRRLSSKKAML